MFCTYLTIYTGNKMPMFYIGYSTVQKVETGYGGSVSSKEFRCIWILERKQNPYLFKTIILTRHVSREEAIEREFRFQKSLRAHTSPMYINRGLSNGKFRHDRVVSLETRKKLSASLKGKKLSQEHKEKIRIAATGRRASEETKQKMSQSRTGLKMPPRSQEWCEKQRAANLGKRASEETKQKMSQSHMGRKNTPETIEKMRAAARARWARASQVT